LTELYKAAIAGTVLLGSALVISLIKDIPSRNWKRLTLTLSITIPLLVYLAVNVL
jgi:hypothetical protein